MINEIWKDIPGYEGLYQVSTMGRVRSLDVIQEYRYMDGRSSKRLHKGRILKPYAFVDGFLTVTLYKEGVREVFLVHRLVATMFLENPKGYKMVSFRDKNKYNLKLENLMWGRKGKRNDSLCEW